MTDQNTPAIAADAVERVAAAIHGAIGAPVFASDGSTDMYDTDIEPMATAAIQAHTAYLWGRADSRDVKVSVARAIFPDGMIDSTREYVTEQALTTFLTALLGPRPEVTVNPSDDRLAKHIEAAMAAYVHAVVRGYAGPDSLTYRAAQIVAAVRDHDAGLPCGFCDGPGADEIPCACQVESEVVG